MRTISDTIVRLQAAASVGPTQRSDQRMRSLEGFGSNPGQLKGWYHVPGDRVPTGLVVVLHGCTQDAAGYDRGSGWSNLAERHGFAVLFPEQQRANNANLCFNWFSAEDIRRDSGEALSIRQMIAALLERHAIDPARVHITGLSAGGAMTAVMLATYPEVFAAGAVIAGLPFATALSVPQAFDRMRGHGHATAGSSAASVRSASAHRGPWPALSVWHGTADRTVDLVNADALIDQWRQLSGLKVTPDRTELVDGHPHRVWLGADRRIAIEDYRITGMGHGTPLDTQGERGCGVGGAFMLDVGISSTWHMANRWELIGAEPAVLGSDTATAQANDRSERAPQSPTPPADVGGIQATIESALRAAGLMR